MYAQIIAEIRRWSFAVEEASTRSILAPNRGNVEILTQWTSVIGFGQNDRTRFSLLMNNARLLSESSWRAIADHVEQLDILTPQVGAGKAPAIPAPWERLAASEVSMIASMRADLDGTSSTSI